MDAFLQLDIFFFVTTVVTILVGILIAIALAYLAFILRDLKHITYTVRSGADILAEDIGDLRDEIKREGVKIKSLVDFTKKVYKRSSKSRTNKK